jgi:hypothetical protein
MLALLKLWQPQLQNQRQQLARESAMRLASDLSERMHLNATQAQAYAQAWQARPKSLVTDCVTRPCRADELAAWDVQRWRLQVQSNLPSGDAAVFNGGDGWWGIVLAWQDDRELLRTDNSRGTPACPAHKSCWRLWIRP